MTTATPLAWRVPGEVEVFGERLRDARVIQRLKAGAVAEAAGLSPERYSRLETNLSTTLAETRARTLALAVGFPAEFLSSPPVTPVQRGSLLFRAKSRMSRAEEDQLVAWARLAGDLLHFSELERVRLPYLRLPRPAEGTSPPDAAAQTREMLGVERYEPIAHLVRVLERGGVYVGVLDLDTELHTRHHDAFSTWVGPRIDRPLLVVRDAASWERSRLSVAHELGHLVLHYARRDGDLEGEAFAFAAEFLLPEAMLRREWPEMATLLSLMALKRRWGMSLAALIEHGHRHGLLEDAARTSLYKQLSNRRDKSTGQAWRVREPGWNEREPERPKLLAKVAETAFGAVGSSEALAKSVGHWRGDLMQQLIAGQVTAWARDLAAAQDAHAQDDEGELAQVVPLRRHG